MLTTILLAMLCDPAGCIYMDATARMKIASDAQCVQKADKANNANQLDGEAARFFCLPTQDGRILIAASK